MLSPEGDTLRNKTTKGIPVPGDHDGMAAFAGPGNTTVLVRNHEVQINDSGGAPVVGVNPYDGTDWGGTTAVVVGREPQAGGRIRHQLGNPHELRRRCDALGNMDHVRGDADGQRRSARLLLRGDVERPGERALEDTDHRDGALLTRVYRRRSSLPGSST